MNELTGNELRILDAIYLYEGNKPLTPILLHYIVSRSPYLSLEEYDLAMTSLIDKKLIKVHPVKVVSIND